MTNLSNKINILLIFCIFVLLITYIVNQTEFITAPKTNESILIGVGYKPFVVGASIFNVMESNLVSYRTQAINDYLNGMSYREVAKKHKVNHKTVRRWFIKSKNKSRSKEEVNLLMSQKLKGIRRSIDTEFKKGLTTWNKGTKGMMKSGSDVANWKGDNVGYDSLHDWVKRHKIKTGICQFCESMINVQWANKSHEYKRNLEDWIELCYKCHRKYDRENGWGMATRKYPELVKRNIKKKEALRNKREYEKYL